MRLLPCSSRDVRGLRGIRCMAFSFSVRDDPAVSGVSAAEEDGGAGASAPSEAALREAALSHLARYASTEAGLCRVLERRIARWRRGAIGEVERSAEAEAAARATAHRVVAKLKVEGLVDDAAFAAARAARLHRAGRSRRVIAAHLAAKGVTGASLRDALPEDPESELAAALAFARRRRLGPFRTVAAAVPRKSAIGGEAMGEMSGRDAALLARAGFPRAIVERALAMPAEAALEIVLRFQRGGT